MRLSTLWLSLGLLSGLAICLYPLTTHAGQRAKLKVKHPGVTSKTKVTPYGGSITFEQPAAFSYRASRRYFPQTSDVCN